MRSVACVLAVVFEEGYLVGRVREIHFGRFVFLAAVGHNRYVRYHDEDYICNDDPWQMSSSIHALGPYDHTCYK